jgi:hypothetical protein
MVGVFFMSNNINVSGLKDHTIYLFDNPEQAHAFILMKLLEAGEVDIDEGEYLVGGERFKTREDAIAAAQDALDPLEFFHAYLAVDHRTENSAKIESE